MTTFSDNLQILRKSKGRNQGEMADSIGVKRNTWSNYENGVSEPDISTIIRIAKYFDISIDRLLREDLGNDVHLLERAGTIKKTIKSTPNSAPISTPNAPILPSNDIGLVVESLKAVIAAKDETISSQALALKSLQALLDITNQEVTKISTENAALKRELPGSIEAIASTPGKTKATT